MTTTLTISGKLTGDEREIKAGEHTAYGTVSEDGAEYALAHAPTQDDFDAVAAALDAAAADEIIDAMPHEITDDLRAKVQASRADRAAAGRGRYTIGLFTVDLTEHRAEDFPTYHVSNLGWHAAVHQTGFGNELPGRSFSGATREEVEAKAAAYVATAKVWIPRN
jgi:hypothetical protein